MSSSMEFWGVEVKAGQPLKVTPEDDVILHLSHAALGEAKKSKENVFVPLFIKVGDKKLVLGTLSPETIPQLAFDLVLEKEFELSHNWKNGSIYFTGYKSILPDDDLGFAVATEQFSDFGSSDEEEEEEIPVVKAENGKVQKAKPAAPAKAAAAKPEASKPKSKAAVVPAKPENESDDEDDSDDESEDDEDDSGDDESGEDMSVDAGADSDDDEDDDSDDEETPTPKKPEQGKKRSNDSAVKTPVPAKKAKQATPAKTDGKKAGHTATPHPAKNVAKTAGSAAAKTPKSGGSFSCKSCDRSFGSDAALDSHSKAKHTAK